MLADPLRAGEALHTSAMKRKRSLDMNRKTYPYEACMGTSLLEDIVKRKASGERMYQAY